MEPLGLLPSYVGTRAYDREGARLGHVADVLFDTRTLRPDWLLLVLLRGCDRFVLAPARGARQRSGGVVLAVDRGAVRTAPVSAGPPDALGPQLADALCRHYGVRTLAGPWEALVEPALGLAVDRVRLAG